VAVADPARLDESLDGYAEDRVGQYGGLSRMVNRNDDTVIAVFVGGRAVFLDGRPTGLVGKQRTAKFLRAARQAPLSQQVELASVR
jgi:N-acyl-D-aspartate/D-glutamate deacylase